MKLPFSLDRTVNMSLGEQMFQGLKKAIIKGDYKPGQTLPGIHELAAAAGVSEKVSRQALARLADIDWCVSKRGFKSVVADRGKERLGKVLFFNSETGFGFHTSRMVGAIRSRLLKADYRMTAISAYDLKKDGSSRLLSESLKEHRDLVIELGMRTGTHANRGLGPFWVKPLTRLEMDPVAQGAAVAQAVLEYFKTRHLPSGLVLGSEWKPGRTF